VNAGRVAIEVFGLK